ncbi:MAG: putative baseplate assembly protein [Spirochaetes bacterium]|nr:putative baseplate assembly protein [Spirochaetota bacterium]
MIQSPNLDDRTYQEIVDEAIRLIPHYCPEWTNHNPTDPGITLIELFGWMVEMVIYRLNKVPEKNYLSLLDLVGLSLVPPQPSKALLTFSPVEGYDGNVQIKRNTLVSIAKSESMDAIIFETDKNLVVSDIKLTACSSSEAGRITDNIGYLNNEEKKDGFPLFSGKNEVNRYLYISDPSIGFLSDNNAWNITFNCANEIKTVNDEIVNFLEWEYWNGKKWTHIDYARSLSNIKKQDNEIYFIGPIDIEETEVENIKGYFLRASLINIPERKKCFEINDVVMKLLFHGEGLIPDRCICNTENMVFNNIDINKDFQPFLNVPKHNDAFYMASDDVFSKEDSEIIISIYISDAKHIDKSEQNTNLIIKYEYWNGKNWLDLGTTTTKGVYEPKDKYNFIDTTNAFTKTGNIKFKRPDDMKMSEIYGQKQYWIRARICAGDFGTGGQFEINEHGKWEWNHDKPLHSPLLSQIRLRYIAIKKPIKYLLSYYDFSFFDFSETIAKNVLQKLENDSKIKFFNIFEINKEKCPITYFGFNNKFPAGENGMFFKINENRRVKPGRLYNPKTSNLEINITKSKRPISLKWEYWNGKDWKNLSINDYMDNFHESGFIEFKCPDDFVSKKEFNKNLFWLRLIFELGSFEINPKILNIHLNSVYAYNHQTYTNENLGSSNGTPSQQFNLLHGPVLPNIEIAVRENERPPANERDLIIEEEGEDAIIVEKDKNGKDEVWIKYHQVENFYASKPNSRHYCIDYMQNSIIFGNGSKGAIPPRIKGNLKILKYKTGGGVRGNIGANTINNLREKIPYIASVTNHYSAEGGSDLEDIDRLKERATYIFKNLNRAVTAEDYEWLAKEASTSVARSKCLSKCGKNGEVILIIVPRPDTDNFNMKEKLYPSSELLRRVKEFLDVRKLVGTKLKVEAPAYKNVSITIKLAFKENVSEIQILMEQVDLLIRRYLHPITGGPNGDGWIFGMPLTKNKITNLLEKIDGVNYTENIEIINDDANVQVEKLTLDEDEIIYVNKINITGSKNKF